MAPGSRKESSDSATRASRANLMIGERCALGPGERAARWIILRLTKRLTRNKWVLKGCHVTAKRHWLRWLTISASRSALSVRQAKAAPSFIDGILVNS